MQNESNNSPWLVYNLSQYPHCIVIAHILKVDVIHLGKNKALEIFFVKITLKKKKTKPTLSCSKAEN